MTKEQKAEALRQFKGDSLLDFYDYCAKHFNPFDDDFIETFELLKIEMLTRLSRES